MRQAMMSARRALARVRPTLVQAVGAGGVSWGLWDVRPWAGKLAAGVLLLAFGVAAERDEAS